MEIKDIQRIAKEGFDLWQYGKRVESMEKLCQSYAHLTEGESSDSIDLEIRQHLLHGIERYFRIILRAESIPIDELAKIEVVLESRLGCHHEKTVTLCRRIAELCVAPDDKQKWYKRAYENSNSGDLDSRDALQKLSGEEKTPFVPQLPAEPEGMAVQDDCILLLNGKKLKCMPKTEYSDKCIDNEMKLDTSGVYLRTNHGNPHANPIELHPDRVAFLQSVFFLFENRETIFNDSRMFLAHVPIKSGLAYTGASGFIHPTLGVYLELWERSGMPITIKKGIYPFAKEYKAMLYHIAGSPLTGSNKCSFVTPKGTSLTHSLYPFSPYWRLFQKINTRYDAAKLSFQAYTIREVVEILHRQLQQAAHVQNHYLS